MRKHRKLFITAITLLVLGILVCGISFVVSGFDFKALDASDYVTNTYEISEDFSHISIKGDTEKIAFAPAEDGKCLVVCYEDKNDLHKVGVQDDTLTIEKEKSTGWWFIGFNLKHPEVTVYLPEEAYETVKIDADTGDVTVPEGFSFKSLDVKLDTGDIDMAASAEELVTLKTDTGRLDLHDMKAGAITLSSTTGYTCVNNVTCEGKLTTSVSTGKTDMSDVTCTDFYSTGSTGSITLNNVIAAGEFNIQRDTGDVRFNGCDAETIYVDTDTGDVTGTLLSEKVFITDTDTGKVNVPKTITGGRCEITTDTGDINISVQE